MRLHISIVTAFAATLTATTAAAQPRVELSVGAERVVVSTEQCPTLEQIRGELTRLVPDLTSDATPAAQGDVAANVADRGATYRVSIGDRARDFVDEGRHCQERARTAAVFIAVTLDPPAVPPPPPVAVAPQPIALIPQLSLRDSQVPPGYSADRDYERGKTKVIAGALTLGVGVVTSVAGAFVMANGVNQQLNCLFTSSSCIRDGQGTADLGASVAIVGSAIAAGGVVVLAIGAGQMRQAKRRKAAGFSLSPYVDGKNAGLGFSTSF